MKLLIGFGTRPEWLKLKPLITLLKEKGDVPFEVVFTGQHADFDEYEGFEVTVLESQPSLTERLDNIVGEVLIESCDKDIFEGITHVLVQGDTTSAFALALAAFHRKIPVLHLEAGMRSKQNYTPFPEEFNRRAIGVMASYHFCPTKREYHNLANEGVDGNKYIVGNTSLDNLVDLETSYTNKVLITIHRRENHENIREWFEAFEELALFFSGYEFIFPMHLNPTIQEFRNDFTQVKVMEPLEHKEFLNLLKDCSAVITDSGGVQEESVFLGKKVFVCRDVFASERVMDYSSTFISKPSALFDCFKEEIGQFRTYEHVKCPYGDGDTSNKVYHILRQLK